MDLLFKRYASPLLFMDSLLSVGKLAEGIIEMIRQNDEEMLWQLYLHSFPDKSFEEWKKAIMAKEPNGMTKAEITTEVEKANKILNTFQL